MPKCMRWFPAAVSVGVEMALQHPGRGRQRRVPAVIATDAMSKTQPPVRRSASPLTSAAMSDAELPVLLRRPIHRAPPNGPGAPVH